jgi:hypothetical protein
MPKIKSIPALIVLFMWFIAIFTSWIVLGKSTYFGILGPVFTICMIISVITVRISSNK